MPATEEEPLPKISETMEDPGNKNISTGNGSSTNNNIRRYLVLLHDCICIKFITVQQAQQRTKIQSPSFHHSQCSSSVSCHCSSAAEDLNGCQTSGKNSCDSCGNKKGGKCDWKSNNHDDSHDRGDHQECQYYRNQTQMGYHQQHPHVLLLNKHQSSVVKGGDNEGNNDSSSNAPHGDHVNHAQINSNNKANKSSTPSVVHNKGDYDIIHNHQNQCCCKCSSINNSMGEWESKKHNEHLSDAKGTTRSARDEQQNHGMFFQQSASSSSGNNICSSSIMTKVDHSMQALFLYKEFREINMNCFWNSTVHEAFKNLEYKGSIVPSTIIVGSSIRKHLTVLKTAWSRKMLRSPSGYLIDFLGEIEELIADPIGKSHFVPLSDSLCWAIHELTSSGQEAFVDDIFLNLASAFPGMALPTKELIYQTLEKLTRERKIYQTAQGYFVVTPDTHRYIMSTEPLLMQATRADTQMNAATAANFLRNTILLQQASSSSSSPSSAEHPKSSLSPNLENRTKENDVGTMTHAHQDKDDDDFDLQNETTNQSPSPDPDTYSLPYGTFRRYNSLRIRKSGSGTSTGCLPRRTLSMRLPKSKSKNGSKLPEKNNGRQDVTGSFQNLDSSQVQLVNKKLLTSRRRKHKSFLSRLLSFRGVRKSSTRKDKSGRVSTTATVGSNTKPNAIPKGDKGSSGVLITRTLSNTNNAKNEEENMNSNQSGTSAGVDRGNGGVNNLQTTSTQTSFSIENLNGDLHLLSLGKEPGQSKSSTLDREDSDSGRCTDSHSDADAEIAAALSRGLTPTMHDHHMNHHMNHFRLHHHDHDHHSPTRRSGSSCNVYEKIESDLGLKVDVDECDGRSPRSPSSSQMSVSPSPSTFTVFGTRAQNGYLHPHHHHARHNLYSRCHSSASSSANSYRDFYNVYRRRYPSYQQSTPTTPTPPTSLESGDHINEAALRFKPQLPIRYPPRSFERKQIFDEISRNSFKEKKSRGGNKSVSICIDNPNPNSNAKLNGTTGRHHSSDSILQNDKNGLQSSFHGTTTLKTSTSTVAPSSPSVSTGAPTTTTTYLTQTLKNSTNLELEFRLPLGNIFNAAMGINKMNNKLGSEQSPSPRLNENESGQSPKKREVREEDDDAGIDRTLNEVNTMVNDLFTIKSFVKSNPFSDELSSTIEFKTSNNLNNNNNSNSKAANYVIEAVSSKPFADIHTKFNRESEII